MKILLLNQAFYPDTVATSTHVTDLALFLAHEGHEVSVITGQRDYVNRDRKYAKRENYRGVQVHRVRCTGLGKRSLFTRVVDALSFQISLTWKMMWFSRQDVVVAFTSPPLTGFIAMFFCLFRHGRCVQWLMDMNPHTAEAVGYLRPNALITQFLHKVFQITMRKSDHVVVLDRWMKQRAVKDGAQESSVSIVPPWPVRGLPTSASPPENAGFRARHNLQNRFIVLYAGNHSIAHPLDTLLDAAVKLKNEPDLCFVFVGGGLRVDDVTDIVEQYNLENVIQLPPQPGHTVSEMLASVDVHVVVMGEKVSGLVHPSKIYPIMATGKPFIFVGPKNSAVVDLIQDDSGGFHVEHGESDKLVEALQYLQDQSFEQLAELGKRNPTFVEEEYAAEKLMRRFLNEVILFEPKSDKPPLNVKTRSAMT